MVPQMELATALIECRADITVIQEMRWIGQGCESQAHCDIYYSCHAVRREFGCGSLVGRTLPHLVSGFAPVNKRLAKIRIKAKFNDIRTMRSRMPSTRT